MSRSRTIGVLASVLLLVLAASVGASASGHLSISGPADTSASQGSTVSVTYSVTNSDSSTSEAVVTINNSSLPAQWTVSDVSGTDPNPSDAFAVIEGGMEVAFSDVNPNETVTVTATVEVPSDASIGTQTLPAELADGGGNTVGTAAAAISVSHPLSFSSGDNVSVEPGDSAKVPFSVTNTGAESMNGTVQLNSSSIPSNWTVSGFSGTDPNPEDNFAVISDDTQVTFTDIDAGETVTATAELTVPDGNESLGNYSVVASLQQENSEISSAATNVTVEQQQSVTDRYDEDNDGVGTTDLITGINDYRNGSLDITDLLTLLDSYRGNN